MRKKKIVSVVLALILLLCLSASRRTLAIVYTAYCVPHPGMRIAYWDLTYDKMVKIFVDDTIWVSHVFAGESGEHSYIMALALSPNAGVGVMIIEDKLTIGKDEKKGDFPIAEVFSTVTK